MANRILLFAGCGGISLGFSASIFDSVLDGHYACAFIDRRRLELMIKAAFGDEEARNELEQIRDEELKQIERKFQLGTRFSINIRKDYQLVQKCIKTQVKSKRLRLLQQSQRQPQGDSKTVRLAATMPVPPMINMKGGQFCVLRLGA